MIFRIEYFYIIISWVDQNLSSLFLNELIDLACITEFGRLFHGSDTLRGNAFFLKFIFALWVNILIQPKKKEIRQILRHFIY